MKVLLINGSPRKEGNTHTALTEIAAELKAQGVESEILWIGNKPVRGCIACAKCKEVAATTVQSQTGKPTYACVFNDDVTNTVIARMAECDAIVVGSPVYYGQPSGQVMCLQQRMMYAGGANFQGKPAAAVAVCRRGGASAAYQTLLMPFLMMNMPIVTSQYWNIAYGRTEGETAQDVEGMQTMRTLARNMAWMLQKLHGHEAPDTPEREPWTPMHFIR